MPGCIATVGLACRTRLGWEGSVHRGRVMRKMKSDSLAELVNVAIKLDREALTEP